MHMRAVALDLFAYPAKGSIYSVFIDNTRFRITQPFPTEGHSLSRCRLVGASIIVQNSLSKPLLGDPAVEELQAGLRLIKGHHVATCIQSHVGEVTI
jgi:hypothetical protein